MALPMCQRANGGGVLPYMRAGLRKNKLNKLSIFLFFRFLVKFYLFYLIVFFVIYFFCGMGGGISGVGVVYWHIGRLAHWQKVTCKHIIGTANKQITCHAMPMVQVQLALPVKN